MKERFKSVITSITGIAIWILAGALLWFGKVDYIAFGAIMGIGYIFLVAKDSLLQGLSLGFFKPKE